MDGDSTREIMLHALQEASKTLERAKMELKHKSLDAMSVDFEMLVQNVNELCVKMQSNKTEDSGENIIPVYDTNEQHKTKRIRGEDFVDFLLSVENIETD